MTERVDDLALLMTLEMGKPLAESKAEILYAAEFLRWFSEEAVRIDGRFAVNPNGSGRLLTMKAADRPVPAHHPVELPDRDGDAQDRPGDRGGLHHGRQARAADPAVDAGACRPDDARPDCPSGVLNVVTTSTAGAVTGPLFDDRSAAQDVIHGLHPGRQEADGAASPSDW